MTSTEQSKIARPGTGTSTDNPAAAESVFLDSTLQLLSPLEVMEGDVVVDLGPGAGSATVALAQAVGERGRVYAVDLDSTMLEATMTAARAAGVDGRIRPILHDLERGAPPVREPVDALWSSACVHHTLDWEASVRALARLLRPGGVLCLAEGGLPARCLPWDVGVGLPGLEIRLDEAHNRWSTQWFSGRAGARRPRRGWAEIMTAAGLTAVTSRTALVDYPAPLSDDVRTVVLDELAARVNRAKPYLHENDAAAWELLLDPTGAHWLGRRTDLALLTARTAFWGRAPR
ncbi:class I SAM-dependent methyltransferase [Nocardia goodfellowii]|uniref:SAM-dependent methyltransferase n=1 Tax=Nocardia goodfellowii TaxID=882446 RepID=A0ABS4QHD7_9NOCA|nr:class I SAM-dependent methyltransferase [Nocardia goodfellowii]MBP2191097.1 SAM-dependent methyltransferase [Nocardia goodfellowii]